MMPPENSVFVDASAWVALFNKNDQHHKEAERRWHKLFEVDQRPLVTTNWVCYEALGRLRKHGAVLTENLWKLVNDRAIVHWVNVEPEFEKLAIRVFRQHKDKTWSVVDCSSFVLIGSLKCSEAFAFDHDFNQAQSEFSFRVLS